jgi:hypothetical protein
MIVGRSATDKPEAMVIPRIDTSVFGLFELKFWYRRPNTTFQRVIQHRASIHFWLMMRLLHHQPGSNPVFFFAGVASGDS